MTSAAFDQHRAGPAKDQHGDRVRARVTAKAGGLRGRSSSYLHGEKNGAAFDAGDQLAPPRIAIIDGPYDAAALSNALARAPINLGSATCAVRPNSACGHGTFILGLLGARTDAPIPAVARTAISCIFLCLPTKMRRRRALPIWRARSTML